MQPLVGKRRMRGPRARMARISALACGAAFVGLVVGAAATELRLATPSGLELQIADGAAKVGQADSATVFTATRLNDTGDLAIYVFRSATEPDLLLNIQNGPVEISQVPADWWSTHWIVERNDGGVVIRSRWKPDMILSYGADGIVSAEGGGSGETRWVLDLPGLENPQDAAQQEAIIVDAPAAEIAEAQEQEAAEADAQDLAADTRVLLFAGDATAAVTADLTVGQEGVLDDVLVVEDIEPGVIRIAGQGETGPIILNIETGPLAVAPLDPGAWSGQWLTYPQPDGSVKIVNRWKADQFLARDEAGRLVAGAEPADNGLALWRIGTVAEIEAMDEAAQAPDTEVVEATAVQEQPSKEKPAPVAPKPKAAPKADRVATKAKPAPTPAPVLVKAEPEPKVVEAPAAEPEDKEPFWKRIKGETVLNNKNTFDVGPWQSFTKLYATDLLGLDETIWILGDVFQWGNELRAIRGGFQLPVAEGSPWHLRYTLNFAYLEPFPVDNDFQWLGIQELDQRLELYRVTQRPGHVNETGIQFGYLDSDQLKLELGDTVPRDLGFKSRDIGVFTGGYFWGENETIKYNGDYRLSLSSGINVLGASDTFAVREEAEAFPIILKGRGSYRREWKESRVHYRLAGAFQLSDRISEWHNHFALGGQEFLTGFPAGEVAGENGVAISLELGKSFDSETLSALFGDPVTLTPYIRGDAGLTASIYTHPTDPLDYMRDTFLMSAQAGMRLSSKHLDFDVGYGLPVTGTSRHDYAPDGRLLFSATARW